MAREKTYPPYLARADTGDGRPGGGAAPPQDGAREIALVLAVCGSFAAWRSFEQGSERLLRDVSRALEHPAAVLWVPDGELLVARASWTEPALDRAALEHAWQPRRLSAGLAGRAWERREPTQRARPRVRPGRSRPHRPAGGVSASVAVPALAGEESLAVLELYSATYLEIGERAMRVLTCLGELLGEFLERRRGLTPSPMTARELDVLLLAADGLVTTQIAERLSISHATVKTHMAHVCAKLGVPNRTAAVAHALRAGLIE